MLNIAKNPQESAPFQDEAANVISFPFKTDFICQHSLANKNGEINSTKSRKVIDWSEK